MCTGTELKLDNDPPSEIKLLIGAGGTVINLGARYHDAGPGTSGVNCGAYSPPSITFTGSTYPAQIDLPDATLWVMEVYDPGPTIPTNPDTFGQW